MGLSAEGPRTPPRFVIIIGIDGSPTGGGRTEGVIKAVTAAAASDPRVRDSAVITLAHGIDNALKSVITHNDQSHAFVVGSPIYRASYTGLLKEFFDRLPRGMWGEREEPLQGRAVAIVATGASFHHFLALNDMRSVLTGFFAAFCLPPGLYVPSDAFADDGKLTEKYMAQAVHLGRALVEQAKALDHSEALRTLRPQA